MIKLSCIFQNIENYNDGDTVEVSELGKKYEVKLNKQDDLPYNPYF